MEHDPDQSKMAMDRIVDTISMAAKAQLLKALATRPDCASSYVALSMHISA